MPNISNMWDRRKNQDYTYIDNIILDYFDTCGVGVLVHKYIGTYPSNYDGSYSSDFWSTSDEYSESTTDTSTTSTTSTSTTDTATQFEDAFFGENVNRKYDEVPYEIKTIYQTLETIYQMEKYGLLTSLNGFKIEIHLNDCLRKLGRKIMAGDVIEMINQRDDALLGDKPAINRFYVVSDVARARDGWSATWYPHILTLTLDQMTNSQEYANITTEDPDGIISGGSFGGDGATSASNSDALNDMSNAINDEAVARVKFRFLQTDQFWLLPKELTGMDSSWVFDGDANPPPGAIYLGSGSGFPDNPAEDDYFLIIREDQLYPILYQFKNNKWNYVKTDYRLKWKAANRILDSFITNDGTFCADGIKQPSKQGLSKVIKPRATIQYDNFPTDT